MSTYRNSGRPLLHSLSDLWADRVDLWIYCNSDPTRCYRSHKLDLIGMIMRFGDLEVTALRRRLKCDVCGTKDISISMSATGGASQPRRELPPKVRKRIAADRIALGMAAAADARAKIRDGKPMRF